MPSANRLIVPVVAAVLLGVGCSSDGSTVPNPSETDGVSIGEVKQGATEVSLISAQTQIPAGSSLYTFGLVTSDGGLVTGGSPQVFVSRDEAGPALGPFGATFHEFTAFDRFPNSAPRTRLTGFYAAEVDVPDPGNWLIAGVVDDGETRLVGTGAAMVVDGPIPGQVGTEALSVATPVGNTDDELRAICTRDPPDPLHYISLDEALTNGKPTVVTLGTPLLCTSQVCGPVVDETMAVHEDVGADQANFIHVEVYPTRDQSMPAPEFTQWGFLTEPITLVIDRDGIIQARFEGPVTADLITEALTSLL